MKRLVCACVAAACCLAMTACGAPSSPSGGAAQADASSFASTPLPEKYLTSSVPEVNEELQSECGDLVVVGDHTWRCTNGQVLCEDPQTGKAVAKVDVGDLHEGDDITYRALVPWGDDGVLFCLVSDATADGARVELLELALDGQKIAKRASTDASEALGTLFAKDDATGEDTWLEVDMTACDKQVVIAALDADMQVHLSRFAQKDNKLSDLGERPLAQYLAVVPHGKDVLIPEPDEKDDTKLSIVSVDLSSGKTQTLGSTKVESSQDLRNFAYDASEDRLYFTMQSVVYAVPAKGGENPQAIGQLEQVPAQFRAGGVAGGRYVCHGSEGQLLSCDAHGTMDRTQLHVTDTVGVELLNEAAQDFGIAQPGLSVAVAADVEGDELATQLQGNAESCDAFVVRYDTEAWQTLVDGGYIDPLKGSELFSAVLADMPWRMRAALQTGDALQAYPVMAESFCPMINTAELAKLAGVSADQLPTDWVGFYQLLAKLAKDGSLMDRDDLTLYAGEVDVEQFREIMLGNTLQDCVLWIRSGAGTAADLPRVLKPILEAYDQVDWQRLGLSAKADDEGAATMAADEGTFLMADAIPSVEVMDAGEGLEYWPFSLEAGGKRLVSQTLNVLCVNARSPHRDAALKYLEHVWDTSSRTQKMTLCQSVNDPVKNDNYEADLKQREDAVAELEKQVDEASDDAQKKKLEARLEDARKETDKFKTTGEWIATEQSIASYRALQDDTIPVGGMIWEEEQPAYAMYDYLDGVTGADELVKALQSVLS